MPANIQFLRRPCRLPAIGWFAPKVEELLTLKLLTAQTLPKAPIVNRDTPLHKQPRGSRTDFGAFIAKKARPGTNGLHRRDLPAGSGRVLAPKPGVRCAGHRVPTVVG